LKEIARARRIALYSVSGLVKDPKSLASIRDLTVTSLLKENGRSWRVTKDVLALEELLRELVAPLDITTVAGRSEAPGLVVTGTTRGDQRQRQE